MKTRHVMFGLVMLALAAGPAASCKKKEGDKKTDKKDDMAAMDAMDPMARKTNGMDTMAAMDPRPARRASGDLAKQVAEIRKGMESKNWKEKSAARKKLDALIKANEKNTALADLLLKEKDADVVERGIRIWKKAAKEDKAKTGAFVKAMTALFGHKSDRVRYRSALAFWMGIDKDTATKIEAKVKPLIKDESCLVRRAAYDVLRTVYRKTEKKDELKKLAMAAPFDDKCPNVHEWGAYQLRWVGVKTSTPKLTERLRKLATTSPWYLNRCSSLLALGRFKDKETEKIAGTFFKMPAGTALVIYYLDGHSPFTQNIGAATMAECAYQAVTLKDGKRPKRGDIKEALAVWNALAKKKLAPKPPKKACLSKKDCTKGKEFCVANACVTAKAAWKNYWTFRKEQKCHKTSKTDHLRNFTEAPRIKAGFGTHFNAQWDLRKHYQKNDKKKFDAEQKKLAGHKCP
mgnify:CR=1 FL=1